MSIADLKEGEKAIIEDMVIDKVPLKLVELGCLPGNQVELIQPCPFLIQFAFVSTESTLAIREDLAKLVTVTKI